RSNGRSSAYEGIIIIRTYVHEAVEYDAVSLLTVWKAVAQSNTWVVTSCRLCLHVGLSTDPSKLELVRSIAAPYGVGQPRNACVIVRNCINVDAEAWGPVATAIHPTGRLAKYGTESS